MITESEVKKEGANPRDATSMRILLAYDGSRHAQAGIDLLNALPLSIHSSITILAVMPTQYISAHEALQERLKLEKEKFAGKGLEVDTDLRAGNPAATINEFAQNCQVDLTVIGAKGLRATLGILLGGVAQQVVEYSCCPVLVMREPFRGLKRILLVTDGSTFSQLAIEYIAPAAGSGEAQFPLPPSAEVTVMHVLPPPITPEMMSRSWTVGPEVLFPVPPAELDIDALEQREAEEGDSILRLSREALGKRGIKAQGVILRGDAATEIIQYAKEHEVDLIIAGSRGLSPVTGWLLGSVSRKLVHYAGCSVLIVKRPPE
jgi:nucleotide-binding universal stress UspA family protein